MLADGLFATRVPVAIYGVHTSPYEVGQIAVKPGAMMAGRDRARVSINGTGDLDGAAAAVRTALVNLSTISAAQQFQSGPETVILTQLGPTSTTPTSRRVEATITVGGPVARANAKAALTPALAAIQLANVVVSLDYEDRFIAGATNDVARTTAARRELEAALGAQNVLTVQSIVPAFSEDFGSFQERVPGVFFFLGVSNTSAGTVGFPHSAAYVADEGAIMVGARAMAAVLLTHLGG